MLEKIIKAGFCTGCGVCISEDVSKKAYMMENEYGFLVPNIDDISSENKNDMLKVCPFNSSEKVEDEDRLATYFLKQTKRRDDQIGVFNNIYVGYSNEFRETSSSGGIATYVFKELLRQQIVDKLFIVSETNGEYAYKLFSSYNEILKISKTRYIPVSLDQLFLEIDRIDGKIAISGVGCFIKAIRLKQFYNPELKDKIPFLVGIICGGLKSRFFTDFLSQSAGIVGEYRGQDYRIKNKNSTASDYVYGAFDMKNKFHDVRMKSLGDMWGTGLFKANACDLCDDVTTELADISLGDAWLHPYVKEGLGNSVVVTRSKLADDIIKFGIKREELTLEEIDLTTFKKSQQGSFNHRQNSLKFRVEKLNNEFGFVPTKRTRFFKDIPLEQKIVQIMRMKLRKKSLVQWKKFESLNEFKQAVKMDLLLLKLVTKINHRLRKYRS